MSNSLIIGIVSSLIGAASFYFGFKRHSKARIIEDTPRSKVRSVAMGLVELHGHAEAQSYLKTPFSQTECVYYRYEIKEYKERVVQTSKGSRVERRWETVAHGTRRIPFNAKDETGSIPVQSEGAEFNVEPKKVFLQKAGVWGAFTTIVSALKGWDDGGRDGVNITTWKLTPLDPKKHLSLVNHVGDKKYFEYYISPQDSLFIIGTCAQDAEDQPEIRKGENNTTFIISDKSEKSLLGKMKTTMWVLWALGIALIAVGVWAIIAGTSGGV